VIVPRWEWRTFGDQLGRAGEVLASLTDEVQESDEVYLLSRRSDASVKVRGGLMDVKHLQTVNADRLELWMPTMKAEFPLPAARVAAVLTALNVAPPALDRTDYTLAQLETEVLGPDSDLRAVAVHKRRARSVLDGCMVELTDVLVDGFATRTIAVESPDPALVLTTLRTLGLEERRNTCFARGLKDLVGHGGSRFAVIDVGTNSVKFFLAETDADGAVRPVVDRAEVTRLGEGLAGSGDLTEAAMGRTADAIAGMVEEARANGVIDVAAVGTAGLRQAGNRQAFVDTVQARTGVTVEVISGADEARLAYLAATSSLTLPGHRLVVFDSGGGSSQFSFGDGENVDERFSLDVGAVRFTERFGLASSVDEATLSAALDAVAADLERLDGRPRADAVIGIGGTATNLAAVKHGLARYDPDVVHGTVLDLAEIDRQIELFRTRTADERRGIAGLQPARAEVILAGACVVRTIVTKLDQRSLTVSDRGLRHGVFVERFGRRGEGRGQPV
jgi:exopolyphosphatase/guanosine-5'-triphosphate,3'-diphosphate pyrophosphatase